MGELPLLGNQTGHTFGQRDGRALGAGFVLKAELPVGGCDLTDRVVEELLVPTEGAGGDVDRRTALAQARQALAQVAGDDSTG